MRYPTIFNRERDNKSYLLSFVIVLWFEFQHPNETSIILIRNLFSAELNNWHQMSQVFTSSYINRIYHVSCVGPCYSNPNKQLEKK